MTARSMGGVPSPCVDICRMDAATGWCEGCMRTIDEITVWSRLDDGAKRGVGATGRATGDLGPPGGRDGASEGAGGSGETN
jgi:predicted Fe-S protein YdhL (DUF1289 family)